MKEYQFGKPLLATLTHLPKISEGMWVLLLFKEIIIPYDSYELYGMKTFYRTSTYGMRFTEIKLREEAVKFHM